MVVRIVIVIIFLSLVVAGQTEDFAQECNILKTLEQMEDRLQNQESLVKQQTTRLQQQETQLQQFGLLIENQTTQLQQQETQLQQFGLLLENQTNKLQQQEQMLKNQTTLIQQQEGMLKQAEGRIRELEAEKATIKQPNWGCGVLYAKNFLESGVYLISPDGRRPFSVYCDMTDGGWTVIQRRIDGAINFTRTWDEYVNGFGDMNGEYWLGLEKIHRLTEDGAEIYFDIENYDGTRDYAHYKSFTVHDATTLYKMNVDAFGYKGSIAELFSYHDDMKFTTYDRDNDLHGDSVNCALKHGGGGGWWYNGCVKLGCFNGIFGENAIGGISYYDLWFRFIGVKTVTIKLKPRP